jgi:signal transduction histidine kinase
MVDVDTREPLETRILAEQVRLMCELTPSPLIGSVFAGAALAWLAAADHGLAAALAWYASLSSVLLARWRVTRIYLSRPRQPYDAQRWRNILLGFVALNGAIWSLSGTVLAPQGTQRELIVAMFFIAASAAGMASQAPLRHAYAALLIPFMLPYAAFQFWLGGDRVTLALGLLLYVPVMLAIGYRQTASIEQQLRLAIENESLAEELRVERDRASRANRELEVQMAQQTRSTQHIRDLNTELERQAAELRTVNNDLEDFSYSVSHDLRAPLRAIDGFARLLGEEASRRFGEEGRHYLTRIHTNVEQMAALIDDLLEFSRCGRQSLELSRLDMESLARWAAEQARSAHKSSAAPAIAVGKLPAARGDERLIRQVWANLLDNAVKYSSKVATPRITVSAREEADRVVYEIADNGVGFDNKYSSTLFGVFRRLHGARDYPGTGVGLAIVQRIVLRHGGEVWAHSEIDQGATFSFSLPKPALRAVG